MESKSYSQLLGDLSDALTDWANGLAGGIRAETVFMMYVRLERINLIAKLGAGGRSYLAELIDAYLNRAIEKGEALVDAFNKVTPPPQMRWLEMSLAEMSCRSDLGTEIFCSALDLKSALLECRELFAAIDQGLRQNDSPISDNGNGYKKRLETKGYSSREVCEELNICCRTLNEYAWVAGIHSPGIMEYNFRYSAEDCEKICRFITFTDWDDGIVTAARIFLKKLKKGKSSDFAEMLFSQPTPPEHLTRALEDERPASSTLRLVRGKQIPPEHRTRTLTKSEAANLHAGRKIANAASYIARLIKKGDITEPMGGGQQWIFDIREFPASKHEKLS